MNKKYLIELPPRCGKTATQEMLRQLNEQAGEVKIEVPIENVHVNAETLQKLVMPVTNLRCPDCGEQLRYDHETECEIILYCIHCDHKIKAKKG